MTGIVKVDYKQFGVAELKAKEIEVAFTPFVNEMERLAPELEEFYEGLDLIPTPSECLEAGALRKLYVKIRTGTGKAHKEQKAVFLNAGRFVDGLKNAQLKASTNIESSLEKIEKFHINLERDRLAKIHNDRLTEIGPFLIPGTPVADYALMSDDVWKTFLAGTKVGYKEWKDAPQQEDNPEAWKDEPTSGPSREFKNEGGIQPSEMSFDVAMSFARKCIKNDPELWESYKANIAMAFFDEVPKSAAKLPLDWHQIVNNAAERFLKNWTS